MRVSATAKYLKGSSRKARLVTEAIKGKRVEEAKSTGAEALVSACSGCEKNFAEAVAAGGIDLRVLDVLELLEQSL